MIWRTVGTASIEMNTANQASSLNPLKKENKPPRSLPWYFTENLSLQQTYSLPKGECISDLLLCIK